MDAAVLNAIARVTGGNFRLIQRLFAQIDRVLAINGLPPSLPTWSMPHARVWSSARCDPFWIANYPDRITPHSVESRTTCVADWAVGPRRWTSNGRTQLPATSGTPTNH